MKEAVKYGSQPTLEEGRVEPNHAEKPPFPGLVSFGDDLLDEDMKSEKGNSNTAANALALSTEGLTCPFSMR